MANKCTVVLKEKDGLFEGALEADEYQHLFLWENYSPRSPFTKHKHEILTQNSTGHFNNLKP